MYYLGLKFDMTFIPGTFPNRVVVKLYNLKMVFIKNKILKRSLDIPVYITGT